METVGLIVGVAGLAGLLTTCFDVFDKVDSYTGFDSDARYLVDQFEVDKVLLKRWATNVGLGCEDVEPQMDNSRLAVVFEDEEILSCAKTILIDLISIFGEVETEMDKLHLSKRLGLKHISPPSVRKKMGWALTGKLRFVHQIQQFEALLSKLYDLTSGRIPRIESISDFSQSTAHYKDAEPSHEWFEQSRKILETTSKLVEVELKTAITDWLDPVWSNQTYDDRLRRLLPETCNWILSRPEFCHWVSSEFTLNTAKGFWINGPPGCGKTILSARLVHYLSNDLSLPVAYFFFSSDLSSTIDPFVSVRSWVAQLVFNSEPVRELAKVAWDRADAPKATRTEVAALFGEIAQALSGCTFIVDGLDECWDRSDQKHGLRFLQILHRALAHSHTRLLVVSRNEAGIRTGLSAVVEENGLSLVEYQISPKDVRSDIAQFARAIIDRKLVKESWTPSAKQQLATCLVQHSDGMFLWIQLQEPRLRSSKTLTQLKPLISQAPARLHDVYKANWERVCQQEPEDTSRAMSILRWIFLSFRPLTVSELTAALAVPSDNSLGLLLENLPAELDADYVNEEIVMLCGSFIEIHNNPQSDSVPLKTVHFIHFSAKEYLREMWRPKSPLVSDCSIVESQNNELAMVALRYLNLDSTWAATREAPFHMLDSAPFLDYAGYYWPNHIFQSAHNYLQVIPFINKLFHPQNPNGVKWRKWFDAKTGHKSSSSLFYAVHFGFIDTSKYLIHDLKVDVDQPEGPYGTALGAACANGNMEVVDMLLDVGADVNAHLKFDNADPALLIASTCGHWKVVSRLLAWGTDVPSSSYGGLLMLLPCIKGDIKVVEQLLYAGIDPNESLRNIMTPLIAASYGGTSSAAEDFFASFRYKRRVHVDLSDSITSQLPTREEQPKESKSIAAELVRLLLRHGAQVDWQGRFGWTALHLAAAVGNVDCIQALLEGGANVDLVDYSGESAVSKASEASSNSSLKVLLEAGASPDMHASEGFGTLLNSAAFSGSFPLLQYLLSTRCIDCNLKDKYGRNAAHFAALGGNLRTLEFLQRLGVDLAAIDSTGKSLVHYAAMGCNFEILRLALSQDDHKTTPDSPGWSPLHWACRKGDSSLVKLLLQYGFRPTEVSTIEPPYQWSPLAIAFFYDNRNILEDPFENWVSSAKLGICDVSRLPKQYKQYITCCDICREKITGLRFRCDNCIHFDYCFMCYTTRDLTHTGSHTVKSYITTS
ncbi:ankyrin [Lepidopterella palustris CBS 459.81]|uniref:Ankyrin n=1 Tax=Lepidopterella palustris CBS 459.81 TaxID=1314670 RepID=A0A8E2E053_9PEZI|nr:ankyrin [Lepidopterella palustris CBS 459.81]